MLLEIIVLVSLSVIIGVSVGLWVSNDPVCKKQKSNQNRNFD